MSRQIIGSKPPSTAAGDDTLDAGDGWDRLHDGEGSIRGIAHEVFRS
jgi:hypothetical protein